MSAPPYVVEVAATAATAWTQLLESDQEEVLAGLRKLASQPLPGRRSGVIRLRGRSAAGQPLFYSHTPRFGMYHIVVEHRVIVLVIVERPRLDLTRG